jgi:hypothetical protein
MQWGTDQEPHAIAAYSFMHDTDVEGGRLHRPPDHRPLPAAHLMGSIGTEGMCEIKCPNTKTHLDTLMGASIPKKYMLQMQWQMACSGRAWCDFVSYDPRLHGAMQLHVERVQRDPALIAEIEAEVRSFLREVDLAVREAPREVRHGGCVMGRAVLILNGKVDREKAARWVAKAPVGTRVEFKASKRSIPQNDRHVGHAHGPCQSNLTVARAEASPWTTGSSCSCWTG